MKQVIKLAIALGVVTAFGTFAASASPLGRVQTITLESAIEHVRDGCGRGWRYSHRRRACVPYGPPPPRYVRPVDPAAAAVGAVIGGVAAGIAASQRPVRRGPPRRVYRRY